MNIIAILCVTILEFIIFPTSETYEILFPYGYNNLMMRGGYDLPQVQQPTDLLTLSSSRSGWSFLMNPKCSTTATGAIVIGSHCYTVTTTPTAFATAQAGCQGKGGTLAQPAPNSVLSTGFYNNIKARFPTQFATIEAATPNAGTIWIGYQQTLATGSFWALDMSGLRALETNPIFLPPFVTIAAVLQAAAIVNPGTTWKALDPVTTLPYICQFSLI